MHHDFDDVGGKPLHLMNGGAQFARSSRQRTARRDSVDAGARRCEHPAYYRIALLGAGHRLYDVSRIGGMQIAEKTDEASVIVAAHQYARMFPASDLPAVGSQDRHFHRRRQNNVRAA